MNQEPDLFQLKNGIKVAHLYTPNVVAHLGVSIKAGSRYEENREQGLAHFLEHCIFKGTKNRRAYHILSRLDAVGGELNAFTTKEEICVYGSFTNNYFNRASELLSDIIFHSNFPKKEIEKEKDVILDEINSYLDSPSDRIFDDFESYIFPHHPLGNNILGNTDSVKSFSREDLTQYIGKHFTPDNIVISSVGNISVKRLQNILEKGFGSIKGITEVATLNQPVPLSPFYIEKEESNYQSHIMIGGRAPGFEATERRAFTLLINILGGPALNSRLGLSVREKYGYTYNIDASYSPLQDTGYWNIYASTDKIYAQKTIRLIEKELQRFIKQPLTDNQLKKAKQQMKGQIALGMDSNLGTMLNFAQSLLVFDRIDTLEEVYKAIDSITIVELQNLAAKYFNPLHLSYLIYHPSKKDN